MTLKRYNIGVSKIPFASRDLVHEVLNSNEDRGFIDIIGADTEDYDDDFPLGSNTTYSLLLTEEEAAQFAAASNVRYVEEALEYLPLATTGKFYPGTWSVDMRAALGMNDPAVELWHGQDVPLGICDSGVAPTIIEKLALTVVQRQVFGDHSIDEFNTQGSHGSACTSIMAPYGGTIYDALAIAENGAFGNERAAMRWLVDQGVKVVNFSAGWSNANDEPAPQSDRDLAQYMLDRGVVWSTPAGNSGFTWLEVPGKLCEEFANVTACGAWGNFDNKLWDDDPGGGSSHESTMTCVVPSGARQNMCYENDPDLINLFVAGTSLSAPVMGHLIARICTGGRFTAMQALGALKATMRDLGVARSIQGGGMPNLKAALNYLGAFSDSSTYTNLSPNPSCGADITGWVAGNSGSRKTDLNPQLFPRATGFVARDYVDTPQATVSAGTTYTHSATVRMSTAVPTVGIGIRWYNSSGSLISTTNIRGIADWAPGGIHRITATGTAPAGAIRSALSIDDTSNSADIHITGHLCIAGSVDQNYFDGANTNGQATWTGTPHSSSSTIKYKALVQPTRYNLCTNPSFENNTTGWTISSIKSGSTATLGRGSSTVRVGSFYGKVTTTNNEANAGPTADFMLRSPSWAAVPGQTYTCSLHLRGSSTRPPFLWCWIEWLDSAGSVVSQTSGGHYWKASKFEFNRYWIADVCPGSAVEGRIKIGYFGDMNTASTDSFDIDMCLIEPGLFLGAPFDGSYAGASWTSTAGNSTSYLGTASGGGTPPPSGQITQFGFVTVTDIGTAITLDFKGYDASGVIRVSDSFSISTPSATVITPTTPIAAAPLKVTAHLAETGTTAHDYFDGDTPGGSWTGTSGTSTSTIGGSPQPYRVNLCSNPSFESNLTGYTLQNVRSGITAAALTRTNTITAAVGSWYLSTNITGNGSTSSSPDFEIQCPDAVVEQGQIYIFSAAMRHGTSGAEVEWAIEWRTASGTISTTSGGREVLITNEWDRIWITASAPTGATVARPKIRGYNHTSTSAQSFRVDAVHYEMASGIVEYFDGGSTGATWTGTAGNSTSYLGTPPTGGGGGGGEPDPIPATGNFLYRKAYEGFMNGLIDWDTATIKAALVRGYNKGDHTFMSEITSSGGTIVATTAAFTGKTVTDGVANAAQASFGTVAAGAPCEAVIIYQSSAVTGGSDVAASAQRVIAYMDTGENFPITPNGGLISIAFTGRIFEL